MVRKMKIIRKQVDWSEYSNMPHIGDSINMICQLTGVRDAVKVEVSKDPKTHGLLIKHWVPIDTKKGD